MFTAYQEVNIGIQESIFFYMSIATSDTIKVFSF